MTDKILSADVIIKHGTKAAMASSNPVLKNGELGIETDTGAMKLGNGSTTWNNLGYIGGRTYIGSATDAQVLALIKPGDLYIR